jgi:hypothetical protein
MSTRRRGSGALKGGQVEVTQLTIGTGVLNCMLGVGHLE